MPVRNIQAEESLERVWEELCFTRAALLTQPLSAKLAEAIKEYTKRSIELRTEQWEHWEKEMEAQAGIVAVNYMLDPLVLDISEAKIDAIRADNPGWRDNKARETKEYDQYFPIPPHAIAKLAPEAQLPYMRPWEGLLASESYPKLLELLPRLKQAIQDTEAAIKAREDAQAKTALHRLRHIEPFIKEVNTFRTKLYANLLTISQDNKLPKTWADLFFRVATTTPPTAEARGMARALFLVLSSRGLSPTEEQQKKIAKNLDLSLFERWFSKIHKVQSAASVDEIFVE